jgi:hypothetical protein
MSILQRATETLASAEAGLKRLIGEAAEQGEYASVETLVRWASTLGTMRSEEPGPKNDSTAPRVPGQNGKSVEPKEPKRKISGSSAKHKRRAYPVFAKSGDVLVKIAWSKSSKTEYQHKAPRGVVHKLADALARHPENGSVISMDHVLPLKADDGSQIPDYQAYVSLAWFRQIGAVKQNGRQGYTVKKASELLQQVETAWANLPRATAG